ncbi:MAG: hypothetical protein EAZ55_07440 [Cytophagales bacterium]|nr:MAG: hypothetical protein EAZ55_07440 [Cytophagales bacterium]
MKIYINKKTLSSFLFIVSALMISMGLIKNANAQTERSIYNQNGDAIAYLATEWRGGEWIIYFFSGLPAAYLETEGNQTHIFGFNGKHLGWFEENILWDNEGNIIGYTAEANNLRLNFIPSFAEPIKMMKELTPFKEPKEFPIPFKPILMNRWAYEGTESWLYQGVSK